MSSSTLTPGRNGVPGPPAACSSVALGCGCTAMVRSVSSHQYPGSDTLLRMTSASALDSGSVHEGCQSVHTPTVSLEAATLAAANSTAMPADTISLRRAIVAPPVGYSQVAWATPSK